MKAFQKKKFNLLKDLFNQLITKLTQSYIFLQFCNHHYYFHFVFKNSFDHPIHL
jgi:hypothetical protein